MSVLVVGATAGLGRALGRILAERGHAVVLVARDTTDLIAEASHLRTVYGVSVATIAADAVAPDLFVDAINATIAGYDDIQAVLFPIGMSHPEDNGALPLAQTRALLDVNFTSVVAVVEALLPKLLLGEAVIVGFGSVSAVRGRGTNIIYAAAKRALESYFESLRHRLSATRVRVQFYRLGYLDTQQSFGKRLIFPKVAAKVVARSVAERLDLDFGVITLPRYWRLILLVVWLLPWSVFKRMKF